LLVRAHEADAGRPEDAVEATHELFAEVERQAEEARRRAAEAEDAEWRARFKPHAVVQTELTVPSPCAGSLAGPGAG
jgi:hypothetical protein